MLRNKLMTACSVAVLTAALYGCSSGSDGGADMQVQDMQDLQDQIAALEAALGEDQELTPEAITVLRNALAAAQTALTDAMVVHAEALRLAGEMADTDQAEAVRLANEAAAETLRLATEAAAETLRLATEAAAGDKAEALRLAGEMAGTDQAEAVRLANEAAAETLRLAEEAAAETLRLATEAAAGDKAEALRLAGEMADTDQAEAVRLANEAAAETLRLATEAAAETLRLATEAAAETLRLAEEAAAETLRLATEAAAGDKAEALRLAGEMADTDQAEAVRLANEAAAETLRLANEAAAGTLRLAKEAAAGDKAEALRLAGEMADTDQAEAVRLANEAAAETLRLATEAAAETLRLATEAAADDKAEALRLAKVDADAALKAAQDQVDAFATAQNAGDDATGAVTAATTAVEAATEASGAITARAAGVAGDSETVRENAQSVLDARDMANAAVTTAQNSLDAAEAALANVDDSTAAGEALKRAIDAAVETAKAQLAMAKEQAEGAALKMAVDLVTGGVPEAEDYPKTPAQHASDAAMEIGMALMPASDADGGRMHGAHGDTAPADTFGDAVSMSDHQGMTWAEIVGDANIREMRIAQTGGGTGTQAVMAASLAGMPAASASSGSTPTGDIADGVEFGDADYRGIGGKAFCASDDCTVDEDGNLAGSWYFTPGVGDAWHLGTTTTDGVTTYLVENTYATFGHWLDGGDDGDETSVNTFALTEANTGGLEVGIVNTGDDATTLTESSATYSGDAAGMSVHKTYKTDGTINTIDSAAFTADVELKATFGESPTLGGTVDNFQGGAVDSSWEVELQVTAFPSAALANGRTVATGRDAVWVAQGYGVADERPMGIFGGFNAHFTDGHAAGAYATRRD